ncbi:hypothetical protein NEOLEDRAFT_1043089, partial [Neolentinus lepideus HHB14362 ss-1]
QGYCISPVINTFTTSDAFHYCMRVPNTVFWMTASPSMPHVLKGRIVNAFKAIHNRQVLHGDPQLRNMWI